MKLQPTKKHEFKGVPRSMIYEDSIDDKTYFQALMNYYIDDEELKRVKENRAIANMIDLPFMNQLQKK